MGTYYKTTVLHPSMLCCLDFCYDHLSGGGNPIYSVVYYFGKMYFFDMHDEAAKLICDIFKRQTPFHKK